MPKRYSVAIRPTTEEIRRDRLHYDQAYFEDRAETIYADNESSAVDLYLAMNISQNDIPDVGIKKGDRIWMKESEERYVRAVLS